MNKQTTIVAYLSDKPLPTEVFNQYMEHLSEEEKNKIRRYYKWQDAQASLMGKIILLNELVNMGYSNNSLKNLRRDKFNKPYIPNTCPFNISHSGDYVICALSLSSSLVGIDIEKISEIEIESFNNLFTFHEWQAIINDQYPTEKFYSFWCAKEAVSKQYGKGLLINLRKIKINGNNVEFNGKVTRVTYLDKVKGYKIVLATQHSTRVLFRFYI